MVNFQLSAQYDGMFDTNKLIQAAEATLKHELPDAQVELSIMVDSDETIQDLNKQYLDNDSPTDVLSFPADEFDPDEQYRYIGDIIISFPRASLQAEAAGHPVNNELQLLVVHGTLHLLGYDHADPAQKENMWAVQAELLDQIGCTINQLPEN